MPATGRPDRVRRVVNEPLEGGNNKDTRIILDALGVMMQLWRISATATMSLMPPNKSLQLQRTWNGAVVCNLRVPCAGSLSLVR